MEPMAVTTTTPSTHRATAAAAWPPGSAARGPDQRGPSRSAAPGMQLHGVDGQQRTQSTGMAARERPAAPRGDDQSRGTSPRSERRGDQLNRQRAGSVTSGCISMMAISHAEHRQRWQRRQLHTISAQARNCMAAGNVSTLDTGHRAYILPGSAARASADAQEGPHGARAVSMTTRTALSPGAVRGAQRWPV